MLLEQRDNNCVSPNQCGQQTLGDKDSGYGKGKDTDTRLDGGRERAAVNSNSGVAAQGETPNSCKMTTQWSGLQNVLNMQYHDKSGRTLEVGNSEGDTENARGNSIQAVAWRPPGSLNNRKIQDLVQDSTNHSLV